MGYRAENYRPTDQRGFDQGKRSVSGPAGGRRDEKGPRHPTRSEGTGATWIKALAVCGLLVLAVAVIYGQTGRHEFIVCDDDPYVFSNPHVVTGLTADNVSWAMTAYHAGNWHPLTWMSHMLDVSIYGIHHEQASGRDGPRGTERPSALERP